MHALPADHHDGPWDRIFTPPGVKERLLNHALLTLRHGPALATMAGLPHGLIILVGAAGDRQDDARPRLGADGGAWASRRAAPLRYVEIDPHAFPSELLGESQRNISRLMMDTIPELAARRPHTIVLVDEVESFAVRRSAASFETNPVDVHRATDALLAGIDAVAADLPRVLFLATTNFADAVDEAFLSRADLVLKLSLPDTTTIAQIIRHSLQELAGLWSGTRALAQDDGLHAKLAAACAGFDGRRVRKLVLSALALREEVTRDPNELTADDLVAAVDYLADDRDDE